MDRQNKTLNSYKFHNDVVIYVSDQHSKHCMPHASYNKHPMPHLVWCFMQLQYA